MGKRTVDADGQAARRNPLEPRRHQRQGGQGLHRPHRHPRREARPRSTSTPRTQASRRQEELHHPPGDRRQGDHRPGKPATVAKKTKLATTADTFVQIRAGKKNKATFGNGVVVTVGKGDKNATTRFGPGTDLAPDAIEAFISAARAAIGDEAAEVEFTFGEFKFASGADLTAFLQETSEQIKVDPEEVQQ